MICGKCGKTLSDDSLFCPYCGIKLQQLCGKCGAELSPDAAFCAGCGAAVSGSSEAAETKNAAAEPEEWGAKRERFSGSYFSFLDRHAAACRKTILRTIRKGRLTGGVFCDEAGDWSLKGECPPPEYQQKLRESCIPLYDAGELGMINAYTFERWNGPGEYGETGGMYYAAGNAVYGPDNEKLCDCGDVVHMLWADNKLFISEISSLKFRTADEEEEAPQADRKDEYYFSLGLRVVDVESKKELTDISYADAAMAVDNWCTRFLSEGPCISELDLEINSAVVLSGRDEVMDFMEAHDFPENVRRDYSRLKEENEILWFETGLDTDCCGAEHSDSQPEFIHTVSVQYGSKKSCRISTTTFKSHDPEPDFDWGLFSAGSTAETEADSEPEQTAEKEAGEKKEPEKKFDKTTPAGSNYSKWDEHCANSMYPTLKAERSGHLRSGKVSDQWDGAWQKTSPDGRDATLKSCSPLYSEDYFLMSENAGKLHRINAYTFEKWVGFDDKVYAGDIYYAKENAVYGPGGEKFCDCGNVVSLLWAGNMLFINEVFEFTYTGRHSYEWQQGDYGYTSDDYDLRLGLRIIDIPNRKEILRAAGVDAIVSARVEPNSDGRRWALMDIDKTIWLLDKAVSPCTVTRRCSLEERLNNLNIPMSKVDKFRENIVMHYPTAIYVYDKEANNVTRYKTEEL